MLTDTILIIKSCWKHKARRDACRETWLQNSTLPYSFVVGEHPPLRPFGSRIESIYDEQDVKAFFVPDDFRHIGPKIKASMRYAVEQDFDYVAVVDDDTYVVPSRLYEIVQELANVHQETIAFWRDPIRDVHHGYPQGSCYVVSHRAAHMLANSVVLDQSGPDDVLVGEALYRVGFVGLKTDRIHVGPNWEVLTPRSDNDIVSTHKCLPEDMRKAHRIYVESF
jgi:hypothetical protein